MFYIIFWYVSLAIIIYYFPLYIIYIYFDAILFAFLPSLFLFWCKTHFFYLMIPFWSDPLMAHCIVAYRYIPLKLAFTTIECLKLHRRLKTFQNSIVLRDWNFSRRLWEPEVSEKPNSGKYKYFAFVDMFRASILWYTWSIEERCFVY